MDAPTDPTPIRLGLLNGGYQPVPICAPGCSHVSRHGKRCKSGGKAVHISGWTKGVVTPGDVHSWRRTRPEDTNTGILTGEMVGIDCDILNPLLAAKVDALADKHLGSTPLHRIGRAPRWLRCYRTEAPLPKLETPERHLEGETVQVEVMGKGQQVAAYGVHPLTMQHYTWIYQEPLDVPLVDLPVVNETQLRGFLAGADALFVAAGADLLVQPTASLAVRSSHVSGHAAAGGGFFRNVNQAALANIGRWFNAIFPSAVQEPGTGAWRVSSADLGRPLEEDLAMHPTLGGHDFGTREPLSPISAVTRWGGAADAKAAALWLCEKLGRNPTDLGWKDAMAAQVMPPLTPAGVPRNGRASVALGTKTEAMRRSRSYSDGSVDAGEDGSPPSYTLTETGLYYREPPGSDDARPVRPQWICGPHKVLGHARDIASNNWGLVFRWNDRAGVEHVWCVPVALAYSAGAELSAAFASQGLSCASSGSGKDRLKTYIARLEPPRLVTAVTATGWFKDSFVIADGTVIGPNQDEVFLQTAHGAADQAYAQAGDLADWKSRVAAYAIGNHHLALAICTAISGPLFHLLNETSGGWQFVGDSRSGKTTILAAAASVWGPPTPAGFLPSWRATSNGLESICAARCDTALIIDEMGQADPKDVGSAVYMIANGSGKARADRSGGGRQPQTWRLPILSSGEKTLSQLMAQAGLSVAAGQDVRLAVIRPGPQRGAWNVSGTTRRDVWGRII